MPWFIVGLPRPSATSLDPVREVFVVPMMLWIVGVVGLMAGPVLVGLAERATGSPLAARGRGRATATAVVSMVTALLCSVGWFRFGTTPPWLAWCWACALGVCLVVTDLRCRRLPFSLVAALAGGAAVAMLAAAVTESRWSRLGFVCAVAAVVFALAAVIQMWAPTHTGGGDTALYGALALYLSWFGWDGLLRGLLIASALTAVVALVVAARSRSMHARFPAGPSLLAGALVSISLA